MNKYKLLVGAKGVNIETFGPIDIYGTIVNIAAEQMNISSKNEVIIDGGERFSLRARKISLLPVEHNAVVVDGQLHVTRNTVLEGGVMIEGELGLLHITAPVEWQQTEIGLYETVGTCAVQGTYSGGIITIPNHTHYFKGIPFTAMQSREGVRETMLQKGINSRKGIAAASPASNTVGCSQALWSMVSEKYTPIAWTAAKEDAQKKGINVDKEWAQWDDSYMAGSPLPNGPMTNSVTNGRSCKAEELADGTTITTIIATYKWVWTKKGKNNNILNSIVGSVAPADPTTIGLIEKITPSKDSTNLNGVIKVSGKVDPEGNMLEGPSIV